MAATRTSNSMDVRYRSEMSVSITATRVAYTAILVTFQHSPDNGTTWFDIQSVAITTGTGALSDYTASKTVSASANFEARLADLNFKDMRIKVASTAGGASDTFSAWVTVK